MESLSKQCVHKFSIFAAVTFTNKDELWILNISTPSMTVAVDLPGNLLMIHRSINGFLLRSKKGKSFKSSLG